MALFLGAFLLNAGSGVALWLWPTHAWRVLHGCTVPLFLIVFGVVWRFHVVRGWQIRKNVLSGALTLLVMLALTVTGWAIYYAGTDEIQEWARKWHTWLGLGISVLLLAHGWLGWRARPLSP